MASKKQQKCKGAPKKSSDENTGKLIRENMKCPVCMEVLLPPIYQCETGHNICSYCIEEVEECPLCKGDYGDTRNYFAEELVNSMSFPCKFEDYGCTKVLLGSELKDHQEACQFQPYRCPELACQAVFGLHQMGEHLDKHGFPVLLGDVQEASFDVQDDHFDRKTEYNPWRFKAHNTEFYIVSTRQKDGSWYFWTYCLGIIADAKKFSCEIIVYGNNKQCLFRGPIHSLRTQPSEIIENGNCLILTDNMIKSMRQNGKIKSRVRLIAGKNWNKNSKPPADTKRQFKNTKKNPQKAKGRVGIPNGSFVLPSQTPAPSPKPFKSSAPQVLRPISDSHQSTSLIGRNENPVRRINSRIAALAHETSRHPLTPLKKSRSESMKKVAKKASSKAIVYKKASAMPLKVSKEQEDFVLKMRETLKCPGCGDVILPPVHMCAIGHSCCLKCKLSRTDCAICRAPINQARNFFAEELLYKLYQKCTYAKLGCLVCLPSAQMRLHEVTCDFAPFECPFPTCRKLIRPSELLEHLNSHSIPKLMDTASAQIEVPKHNPIVEPVCALPCIVMKHDIGFLPVVARNPNGSWTFFVSSQDHNDYWFELSISKMGKVVAYQGPVVSLRMNQTEIEKNGMSLLLTPTTVRCMKNQDKFSYCVKIFKSSETAALQESLFGYYANDGSESRPVQIELFANKRTSVTPKDDDDSSDDSDDEEEGEARNPISGNQTEDEGDVTEDDEGKALAQAIQESKVENAITKKTKRERKMTTDSENESIGDSLLSVRQDYENCSLEGFEAVDDLKVEKDLADYEKLISISDTDTNANTVKTVKSKSMMLFGQEFEACLVEKVKSAADCKDVEPSAAPLTRRNSCSTTLFPTISLGSEDDKVIPLVPQKLSSGSQTEVLYKLNHMKSQTDASITGKKSPVVEPNALESKNQNTKSEMDLAVEANGLDKPKEKSSLFGTINKESRTKFEQIQSTRQPEKRRERKSRSKLRKSLERLKKPVASTSSSTALVRSKDSKHHLAVNQHPIKPLVPMAVAPSRTYIQVHEEKEEAEADAPVEPVILVGNVKEKKSLGERMLQVGGHSNVTVVDLEAETWDDEGEGDYSSILLNSAAEKVDKVVSIMNEGVEDVTGVVIDSLQAIKSGVDLLGNYLISGTLDDSETDTEKP